MGAILYKYWRTSLWMMFSDCSNLRPPVVSALAGNWTRRAADLFGSLMLFDQSLRNLNIIGLFRIKILRLIHFLGLFDRIIGNPAVRFS